MTPAPVTWGFPAEVAEVAGVVAEAEAVVAAEAVVVAAAVTVAPVSAARCRRYSDWNCLRAYAACPMDSFPCFQE
jgi:hypothetical protein